MTDHEAMRSLPRDERRVLTLRKVYDYSYEQIAIMMHMDERQVERILATAVRHFADALDE